MPVRLMLLAMLLVLTGCDAPANTGSNAGTDPGPDPGTVSMHLNGRVGSFVGVR